MSAECRFAVAPPQHLASKQRDFFFRELRRRVSGREGVGQQGWLNEGLAALIPKLHRFTREGERWPRWQA